MTSCGPENRSHGSHVINFPLKLACRFILYNIESYTE